MTDRPTTADFPAIVNDAARRWRSHHAVRASVAGQELGVLAIDPGTYQSAWLVLRDGQPEDFGYAENGPLLLALRDSDSLPGALRGEGNWFVDHVAIETIEPRYGVPVGRETIDTSIYIGRLMEAVEPIAAVLLKRSTILTHLGVATHRRAGEGKINADAGVKMALTDRFGPKGTKKAPGALYGVSGDIWSALSVAVTYWDEFTA